MKKRKRYSFKNTFMVKLKDSIKSNEYRDHEPEYVADHLYDDVKFLPKGEFNSSISIELLSKLPLYLKRDWNIIDLDKYFEEPPEEEPETRIESISKTPVNVLLLSEEKKIQLKATALGLARNEEYSKQVGLDGKEDEEESVKEEKSDDLTDIFKKYGGD